MRLSFKLNHSRLEILGALLAALIAAGAIFWWLTNLYNEREPQSVVAAATDLSAPRVLKEADLITLQISRRSLPDTAVVEADQIVGQVLTRSLSAREVVTTADLVYNRDPGSEATLVPTGLVGFVLPGGWLTSGFPKIKKNDFITIMSVWPATGAPRFSPAGAGPIARGIPVLSVSADKDSAPSAVFIALTSELVGRLMQLHASGYPLAVVAEPANTAAATSTLR